LVCSRAEQKFKSKEMNMMLRNDVHDQLRTRGEVWRDRLLTTAAAVIFGLTLSNVAPADEISKETKRTADAEYNAVVEKAEADYKAARERCDSLAGNEKDICVKDAKAEEKRVKADAKALKKSTKANAEANEEKREAEFKVAKEKCDSMTGNDKDVCEREAEAKYKH